MRFAKLKKPPLSIKPLLKSAWKNKPPGGVNRGFMVYKNFTNGFESDLLNELLILLGEILAYNKSALFL